MQTRAMLVIIALLAVACGQGDVAAPDASTDTTAGTPTTAAPVQSPTPTVRLVDNVPGGYAATRTVPLWEGFEATSTQVATLAARAKGSLDVYDEPGAVESAMTLDETTILGTVTVLAVVTPPTDGWIEVMLPVRPNGTTGWIREDQVSLYVADSRIVVDLSARELVYTVDGVTVLETEVGIGSRHNQTPPGEYFVTDSVTLADPNSPWGPHALGISARSETITSFNGGDGIIGIHGTNNPNSIGGNISLGCVRLPNDMITALHSMVPLGTRVEIRA